MSGAETETSSVDPKPNTAGQSRYIGGVVDALLDVLFPPKCLICDNLGGSSCLCASCIAQIEPVDDPPCPECGLTMLTTPERVLRDTQSPSDRRRRGLSKTAHLADPSIPAPNFCPHCSERTPTFDKAGSLGAYRGVLREAIHILKYRDKPQLAKPLARLLADYARTHSADYYNLQFDAVIAVPMHPSRKRQRGYNQAERLAAAFCQDTGLALTRDLVQRRVKTRSQVGLTARERAKNIADAFHIPDPSRVAGKVVLIVDDVTTTGSTLNECARCIKSAGAHAVFCLTLAAD